MYDDRNHKDYEKEYTYFDRLRRYIQEEAPILSKPVLVMRDATECPEAVDAGTVRLVGTDRRTIIDNVSTLLTDK